jgi:hypothetical protein
MSIPGRYGGGRGQGGGGGSYRGGGAVTAAEEVAGKLAKDSCVCLRTLPGYFLVFAILPLLFTLRGLVLTIDF